MMEIKVGGFYRHFKGNLYQVREIAINSETNEKMVVYQALYGNYEVYVRPYESFVSEVDRRKYPDADQKFRFEETDPKLYRAAGLRSEAVETDGIIEIGSVCSSKPDERAATDERIAPILMKFLEADTVEEKLEVIKDNIMAIDEKTLTNIEASLDIVGADGSTDDRIRLVMDTLRTRAKYENMRLR